MEERVICMHFLSPQRGFCVDLLAPFTGSGQWTPYTCLLENSLVKIKKRLPK